MAAGARIGDPLTCGDTIVQGSGNVFFNGIPVARIGDATSGHGCHPPSTMATGNGANVYANNILICVVGSSNVPHTCKSNTHSGTVSAGSPDVFIG